MEQPDCSGAGRAGKWHVAVVALAGIFLLPATSALAGTGLGVTPNYPATVKVGQLIPVSIQIRNANTLLEIVDTDVVDSITVWPACGTTAGGNCTLATEDTNVFSIPTGSSSPGDPNRILGRTGTSCAGVEFTVSGPDAGNGNALTYTPNTLLTVGPPGGGNDTCIIDYKVTVLATPAQSPPPTGAPIDSNTNRSGLQIVMKVSGDGTNQNTGEVATGTGSSPTSFPVLTTSQNPTSCTLPCLLQDTGTLVGTTVNNTPANTATGTVTFKLYDSTDPTCAGSATNPRYTEARDIATQCSFVLATGLTCGPTVPFAADMGGTWHWTAEYSGDANNVAVASACAAEPVQVGVPPVVIQTFPQPDSGTMLATALQDSADLSGGFNPTGTITFTLHAPADSTCVGAAIFTSVVPVSGTGVYFSTAAPAASITQTGTYHWKAVYSGDAVNDGVTSLCADEPVVITKPVINIVKTPGAPTYTAGQTITFSIQVTNSGPGTAVNVHFAPADALPDPNASLNWSVSQQPAQGGCTVTGALGSQLLNCNFGNMLEATSATVVVSTATEASDPGDCGNPLVLNNSATVVADNADPKTGAGSQSCTGLPQLSIQKTPDAATIVAGDTAQFTIVVSSIGSTTATGVTLNDPLPAGNGVNWTTATAGCSVAGSPGGQTLTCSFGDLASGASRTVVVSAVTSLQACTNMPNLATASATNTGSVNDPGRIVCAPPPPGGIPTLSEWAMLLMMFLVVGSGFVMLRRRAT